MGEMSHLQLSTETGPAWHGDQWCYTRPSYPESAPMSSVQPRAPFVLWCCKSQATVFQSAWTSPTALICGRILASSAHTSVALAELQLTSMDERHKTSAPNTRLFSKRFLLKKKCKAELLCASMTVTNVQGCGKNMEKNMLDCPLQNNQPLQPVHNTHPTLLSPHHLPKTLSDELHALDRPLMRRQLDAR